MSATLEVHNDLKDVSVNVWLEKGPYVFHTGYDSWCKIKPGDHNQWGNRTDRAGGYTVGWSINGQKFQKNVVLPNALYVSHDGIRQGSRTGRWYMQIDLVNAPKAGAPLQGHVGWCWQLLYAHKGNVEREETVWAKYATLSSVSRTFEDKIAASVGTGAKSGIFSVEAKLETEMKSSETKSRSDNQENFSQSKYSFKLDRPCFVYAKTYTVAVGDNKYSYQTVIEDFEEAMHLRKDPGLFVSI